MRDESAGRSPARFENGDRTYEEEAQIQSLVGELVEDSDGGVRVEVGA